MTSGFTHLRGIGEFREKNRLRTAIHDGDSYNRPEETMFGRVVFFVAIITLALLYVAKPQRAASFNQSLVSALNSSR